VLALGILARDELAVIPGPLSTIISVRWVADVLCRLAAAAAFSSRLP
jgi:hypothetical protein